MVIVRGPAMGEVLCAAKRIGGETYVYVPETDISARAALALSAILTDVEVTPPIPAQRQPVG